MNPIRRKKAEQSMEITKPVGYGTWRELIMSRRRAASAKAVTTEIRKGRIPPAKDLVCVDCGKPAQCYDHRDYNYPLMIDPVCKKCDCIRGPAFPFYSEDSKEYKKLLKETKKSFNGYMAIDARAAYISRIKRKALSEIKEIVKKHNQSVYRGSKK